MQSYWRRWRDFVPDAIAFHCRFRRAKYGEFNEYHTSADNLEFVTEKGLFESYQIYLKCINLAEQNHIYQNNIICEPFMSKYNLYNSIGASKNKDIFSDILILIHFIDSKNDIIDISKKMNLLTCNIYEIIDILLDKKIIKKL